MNSVLKCTCWNVNGLFRRSDNYSKLDDTDFINQIKTFDIVGLVETHAGPDDVIQCQDFEVFSYCRSKYAQAVKHTGGISVLVKSNIVSGIDSDVQYSDHAIWLKLRKEFFNLNADLFIGVIYLPPENSTFSRRQDSDVITSLEDDISKFSKLGEILLLGDFNSHIASEMDYIENDSDKFISNDMPYIIDTPLEHRLTQDRVLNSRGKDLLNLCFASRMRILNGRFPGDSVGYFTCH